MNTQAIITLTTDFGIQDCYAGVMKGVMLKINPLCTIVDITHAIDPQDIAAGAFTLEAACPYFPDGAIHVAVVDPGVGGGRRALVVETAAGLFVGPDNGIFTFALTGPGLKAAYELTAEEFFLPEVSSTFHGRDIFAPAAAHLSAGVSPERMGRRIDDPVLLPQTVPFFDASGALVGRIAHIDRFGNLITDLKRDMLQGFISGADIRAACRGADIKVFLPAYDAARQGELFCVIGSSGRLEIALKNTSAAGLLGACRGDSIVLKKLQPGGGGVTPVQESAQQCRRQSP